jgi:hypothetical protein
MKPTYTPEDIKSLRPCSAYTLERIRELWAGREALTADEIKELPIPIRDIGWCLFRLAADPTRRLARRIAADVLDKWNAPEIVKRWIETGDESTRLDVVRAASAAEVWAAEAAAAAWAAVRAASAAWAAEAAAAAYEKYVGWAVEEINSRKVEP